MGPPKARARKTPYSEVQRRADCFEYRWDKHNGSYYLFNPWTGETIFSTNLHNLNRKYSMWAKPDKYPSTAAQNIQLFPEFYASKRWGRRRFSGWNSPDEAAVHMTAVARGFLARLHLRQYYRSRYYTIADNFSGYYYFVDTFNPDADTTYYKPSLAFADDILPYTAEDADDYMQGDRYSKQDFKTGPLIKVSGLSKYDPGRSEITAFLVKNPDRDAAIRSYKEINLDDCEINDIVIFMDGEKPTHLQVTEYHYMRTAIIDHDWNLVMSIMKAHPQNLLVQLYGLHNFAKTGVPMDGGSGLIDYAAQEAMELCFKVIRDPEHSCPQIHIIYALRALDNILHIHPARSEYLNTDLVMEQGEFREAAIESFYKERLTVFNHHLNSIPNETINTFERGDTKPHPVVRPLPRSVEVVEAALQCLCLLAHEIDSKETLAFNVMKPVLHALQICFEDAGVIAKALQFMYNLCYRSESGQETILVTCDTQSLLERIHYYHAGDKELMQQCRRLELALKQDGWRGHVENIIAKEMKNEQVDDIYLQPSMYSTTAI